VILSTHGWRVLPLVEKDNRATIGSARMRLRVVAAVAIAISASSTGEGSMTMEQSAKASRPLWPRPNALEGRAHRFRGGVHCAADHCVGIARRYHECSGVKGLLCDFRRFDLCDAFRAAAFKIELRVFSCIMFWDGAAAGSQQDWDGQVLPLKACGRLLDAQVVAFRKNDAPLGVRLAEALYNSGEKRRS
jgi:hypothetical protein